MAVNKNFVVKNGLEVNTNLIVADAEIGRVGIATTTITSDFHVVGGIGVTDLLVTGIATINNLRVSAGATFLGIATFQGPSVHIDNDLFVGGIQIIDSGDGTTIGTDVNIKNNLKVIGGITTIAVGPLIVGSAVSTGTDGQIFQVSGITSNAYIGGQLGIGTTNPNANHALHVLGNTRLAGVTTFTGISSFLSNVNIAGDLHVDGDIQYDEITGRNLNISGIATFSNLTAGRIPFVGTGSTFKDNPNLQFKTNGTQLIVGSGAGVTVGGGLTASSVMVEDLTNDRVVIAGTNGELEDDANFTFNGTELFVGTAATFTSSFNVGGDVGIGTTNPTSATITAHLNDNTKVLAAGVGTFGKVFSNGLELVNGGSITLDGLTQNRIPIVGASSTIKDNNNLRFVDNGLTQLIVGVGASVGSGFTAASVMVEDLTNDRVVIAGTNGELEDDANFTFNGTSLFVGVGATITGILTAGSFRIGNDEIISSAKQLKNIASLDSTTTATIESAIKASPNNFDDLTVNGIATISGLHQNGIVHVGIGSTLRTQTDFTFNGTELFVGTAATFTSSFNVGGDVGIGTTNPTSANINAALDTNTQVLAVGIVTANKLFGDGSNLTNLPSTSTTINNNADNRLITGSGTANTLEAESTLTFDGTQLAVAGMSTFAGISTFGSGVGIADSIFHNGDDNTQIRFPAADTFTVETAGTERLRINSDGEVGVGVQADGDTLHVKGVSAGSTVARFTSNNTDALTNLAVFERNGEAVKAAIRYNATASPLTIDYGTITNHGIDFFTNNTSRLHIQNTGQIGIGTTDAENFNNNAEDLVIWGTGNQGLTIRSGTAHDGSIMFNDTDDTNQRGIIRYDHTTDALRFHTSGGEAVSIGAASSVGIGTTNPIGKLHVEGNSDSSDEACQIVIQDTDDTSGSGIPSIQFMVGDTKTGRIRGTDGSGMSFATGPSNTDRFFLTADGNASIAGIVTFSGSGAIQVPDGGTADRPAGVEGYFRYNTDDNQFEGFANGSWGAIAGGGGGGVTEVDTTVQTTDATGVGSFAILTHRSAAVIAQINQGQGNCQVGRYLMIHDGVAGAATTTVTVVEESAVSTGSTMLGSFTARVHAGNAELMVNMVSSGIATITTKIDTVTV